MRERGSDEEGEDSDLSEESKNAVKPRQAKNAMASAAREMPPDSSDEEEEEKAVEMIPEENKGEDEEANEEGEDDSDDDEELERLYGMGRNNNKNVKVVPQAKQGNAPVDPTTLDEVDASDDDDEEEEGGAQAQSLNDFLNADPEEEKK